MVRVQSSRRYPTTATTTRSSSDTIRTDDEWLRVVCSWCHHRCYCCARTTHRGTPPPVRISTRCILLGSGVGIVCFVLLSLLFLMNLNIYNDRRYPSYWSWSPSYSTARTTSTNSIQSAARRIHYLNPQEEPKKNIHQQQKAMITKYATMMMLPESMYPKHAKHRAAPAPAPQQQSNKQGVKKKTKKSTPPTVSTLAHKTKVHKRNDVGDIVITNASSSTKTSTINTATKKTTNNTITIGFVVTITGCDKNDTKGDIPFPVLEGASILKYSIHRASIHGIQGGQYDYQLYAIHHPKAIHCAVPLQQQLGYTLVSRNIMVPIENIQGTYLRERISKSGCCGENELIKFEAYTFIQHPIIVLLDLDVLILKPLDTLFNFMLYGILPNDDNPHRHLQWPQQLSPPTMSSSSSATITNHHQNIQLLYTKDYAMVSPKRKIKPYQGGFILLKPNRTVYQQFQSIVQKGDFREHGGWGGQSGKFWGAMTFQGLLPYYYEILYPKYGYAIELNRCIYNNMCAPSHDSYGVCYTPITTTQPLSNNNTNHSSSNSSSYCEDCCSSPTITIDDVFTTHYTLCQKPWLCMKHHESYSKRLCSSFHHEWFRARSEMVQEQQQKQIAGYHHSTGIGPGTWNNEHFYGYCTTYGKKGYIPIFPKK